MAFDPTQFGAIPAGPSGGFNPASLGAQPVSPAAPPSPNIFQRVGSAIGNTVHGVEGALANNAANQAGNGSIFDKLGSEIATGADVAGKVTSAPFNAAAAALPQGVQDTLGKIAHGALSLVSSNPQAATALTQIHQLASQHPQVAQLLSGLGSTAANVAGIEGGIGAVKGAAQTASDVATTARGAGYVADGLNTAPDATASLKAAVQPASRNAEAIAQLISPKLTPTETKIALTEGRILPGQKPGLLHDGTPDTVLPSNKTVQAANTIEQLIPNAHQLSQPELYQSLDTKIPAIAKVLRPQMESVPVDEGTVSRITSDWTATKAKQLANPYSHLDDTKIAKLQQNFEQNFLMKSKSNNLADLWDTRIKYDNSVPSNVKNATVASPETLQDQKSIWLQNREILNRAVTQASTGLQGKAKQAFGQMSDLYQAQKNIQSAYRIPKEGAKSTIKRALNSKTGRVIEGVAAGAGAVDLGKRLGL